MPEFDDKKLDGIELLKGLEPESLHKLESQCRWRRYDAHEKIIDRFNEDKDVFFVITGSVQILNFSHSGREIAFARVRGGGYFGELAAIDGKPRSAAVIALEDSLLAALKPKYFTKLFLDKPLIAMRIIERMARIIRRCDDRIMDLSTLGAVQRFYLELLRLAKLDAATSAQWIIYPIPTQATIASRASTSRETIARAMGQLSNIGIVERKNKTLYIRDKARLEKLAGVFDPDWGDEAR